MHINGTNHIATPPKWPILCRVGR